MASLQLLPAKRLAPDLEQARIGEAKLGCNLLSNKSLCQPNQQLMTEAPSSGPVSPKESRTTFLAKREENSKSLARES
jgi:hypothetical protein